MLRVLMSTLSPHFSDALLSHGRQAVRALAPLFTEAHYYRLYVALCSALGRRATPVRALADTSTNAVLFIAPFLTRFQDGLNLTRIFNLPNVKQWLPPGFDSAILVVHSYHSSIGPAFLNISTVALSSSWEELAALRDSSTCVCGDARFSHLKHPDRGHIITTDPDFLPTENLCALWRLGTGYRPGGSDENNSFSTDIADVMRGALQCALTDFCCKVEADLGVHGCMAAWASEVLSEADIVISAVPHGRSRVRPGECFDGEAFFTSADRRTLRYIHSRFVLTYMDKGSSTFVAYCKKAYIAALLDDLAVPGVYLTAPSPIDSVITDQLLFVNSHSLGLRAVTNPALPYYAAIAKLHKSPPKERFLVCSSRAPSRSASLWLTFFFRAIAPVLDLLWVDMFRDGFESACPEPRSWVLLNTETLIPLLHKFNNSFSPMQHALCPWHLTTFDFTRLYTALPHPLLKSDMSALVRDVFDRKQAYALVVFTPVGRRAPRKAVWLKHGVACHGFPLPHPTPGHQGKVGKVTFRVFTPADFDAVFGWLLDSIYFSFAGRVFRQCIGIPMGTNCAVYVANFFLYCYERRFMQRLVNCARSVEPTLAARGRLLLNHFKFTRRFVDDLLSINNPFFQNYLYDTQATSADGIRGIYPPELSIERARSGTEVDFLDITIFPHLYHARGDMPLGALSTRLFDKRTTEPYSHVSVVRFPHASSMLSASCKYGILTSQFIRFSRIILHKPDFVLQLANLVCALYAKGYSLKRLCAATHRLLSQHPHLFPFCGGMSGIYSRFLVVLRMRGLPADY
jgi:hypothetical protein